MIGHYSLPSARPIVAVVSGVERTRVAVETKHHSADELATKEMLESLLAAYDVSDWAFTKRVVIDEGSIPHSHPVLTLSPRLIFREPAGLLSMYLHEQIHWQLVGQRRQVRDARKELRRLFPSVPRQRDGGAKSKRSTYLHLLVNWLEVDALRHLAGEDTAQRMLAATADGPVYGWVYGQVRDRQEDLAAVVRTHGLLGPLDR